MSVLWKLLFIPPSLIRALPDRSPRKVNLSLNDYFYFTIYTITTTAYGDIIPRTAFSRFLCSIANIYEIFFLVVFINALFSTGVEKKPM